MALLERDAEIGRIASTLASVANGDGAVIPVEGLAGAGKSALLRATAETAAGSGFEVLTATGRDIERDFAFGIVTQLFAAKLAALDEAAREAAFAGAATLARPLFEAVGEPTPSGEVFPRLHGLHWLCSNLSCRNPMLLIVDDAHWADQPSLEFLAYLTPRIRELEICLALGIRSRETEAGILLSETAARERMRAVVPAPLSETAIASLLRDRLGDGSDQYLAEACARATGGNPLFARELIRDLSRRAGSAIDLAQVAAHAPTSVARIVVARVRAMLEQDQRVIRTIAVLRDGADSLLIAELSGVDVDRVATSVDRLIEVGLLSDEQLVAFEHPIVRQAIHQSIPPAERAQAHLDAARVLSAKPQNTEIVAVHMLEADPSIGPAGQAEVEALLSAARGATERGSIETAARFLDRALAEDLAPSQRRLALLELGQIELRLGREASLEHLAEATSISSDGAERAEATLALSTAQVQFGELREAVEVCDRALKEVGDVRELRLALEGQRAHTNWIAGKLTDSERRHLRELEAEVSDGSTPAERGVLTLLAVEAGVSAIRPATEVCELADRALGGMQLLEDVGAENPTYTAAGAAKTLAYDLDAAIEVWSAGIADSRRRGSLYGYANALFSRSYAKHLAGDISGAEADVVEGGELLPESELTTAPMPLATAANVAVERGELDPRIEQALENLMQEEDSPSVGTANYAILAYGRLALSRGEPERALDRFTETGRRADRIGWTGPSSLPWRSSAALALRSLDRREEAVVAADEELKMASGFGAAAPIGIALRAKALVVNGEEGINLAREAVAVLAGSGARLEHAKALIDLGAGLRRAGARSECREPLREGMDLAHRCGSPRAVKRAMSELRASGARPRRPAQRGAASLSPQELQTTTLAAEKLSNREIAESMFITRRTVEMHLTGAYRKLGISSREELTQALGSGTDA